MMAGKYCARPAKPHCTYTPQENFHGWWAEVLADAHYRYLCRQGVIKPRKARRQGSMLVVVTDLAKGGRANPVAVRTLKAALRAAGSKYRKSQQLHYDLALWLLARWRLSADTPKRGLSGYMDEQLFAILQRHGEIAPDVPYWGTLSAKALDRLEKRLHRRWPVVKRIANALQAPVKRLSNSRRRHRNAMQHMVAQLLGTTKT